MQRKREQLKGFLHVPNIRRHETNDSHQRRHSANDNEPAAAATDDDRISDPPRFCENREWKLESDFCCYNDEDDDEEEDRNDRDGNDIGTTYHSFPDVRSEMVLV